MLDVSKTRHERAAAPVERVLSRLKQVRPVGGSKRSWMAQCPAHEDRNPSLAIDVGRDGTVLIHCHAGCRTEAVVAALGLEMADLMPRDGRAARWPAGRRAKLRECGSLANGRTRGSAPAYALTGTLRTDRKLPDSGSLADSPDHLLHGFDYDAFTRGEYSGCQDATLSECGKLARSTPADGTVYPGPEHLCEALERRQGRPSIRWWYTDGNGERIGVVCRWDHPDGKLILPGSRRADGWVLKAMLPPRPLYRLAALLTRREERVYVTEGEKAAEAARTLGLLATTSAGGAGAAHRTDWRPLGGRDVVVLADNDDPGRKYAADVVSILTALDPTATVRIAPLPGLAEGEDIYDWIENHDDTETEDLREYLEALVMEPPVCSVPVRACGDTPDGVTTNAKTKPDGVPTYAPILHCLADIEPAEVSWLWPGRIPLARLTILVGRPGEGKSFLTTDMAARLSTGSPWPDGTPAPRGSVLLICAEDDPRDTICPRLMACGADLRGIHLLSMVRRLDEAGRPREAMFTLADIPALEAALKAHPDCQLVVVDPIGSFLSGGTDAHRDNEVRSVLGPVAKLAEQYGPAVLLVAHPRKSSAVNADDLALGSRAFTGMARAVWHLCRDPQDRTRRLLLSGKNNLAAESHGLAFAIAGEPPRIHWEKDAVMMNANDALAEEAARSARKPGSPPVARKDAQEWLCDLLSNGPLPARQIQAEGEAAGHSLRTLHRARAALGIRTSRIGPGGTYLWMPPGSDDADGTPLSDETQQATLPYAESVADGS